MKPEQKYQDLIIKFFTDTLSEAETHELENWKNENIENIKIFNDYEKIFNVSEKSFKTSTFDNEQLWQKLKKRVDEGKEVHRPRVISLRTRFSRIAVAATIALLLGLGSILYFGENNEEKTGIKLVQNNNKIKRDLIQVESEKSIKIIDLPDGSKVYLEPNSSFSYSSDFQSNRQTELSGEAYFVVSKDKEHPFTIKAGDTRTTVLGTEFRIIARTEDVKINVSEGVVEFGKPGKELVVLHKNETALFTAKENSLFKESTNPAEISTNEPGKDSPVKTKTSDLELEKSNDSDTENTRRRRVELEDSKILKKK